MGEGNDGHDRTDARYAYRVVPIAWLLADESPLTRHLGGANFAFADGHVKFLRPNDLRAQRHGFGLRERR